MQVIAGPDPDDPATASAPASPDYLSGLSAGALDGKRVGVVASTAAAYPAAVCAIEGAGATTVPVTIGTPSPDPPSIVLSEFKRDLNAYLSGVGGGAGSLAEIIDYNDANAVEGLKYQQRDLLAAQAVDLSDPRGAARRLRERGVPRVARCGRAARGAGRSSLAQRRMRARRNGAFAGRTSALPA